MLEYTLTVDDLAAYAGWQARRSGEDDSRRRRLRLVGGWIGGGIGYLVVFSVLPLPLLVARELPLAGLAELLAIAVGLAVGMWEWRRGGIGEWLLARRYRARARVALEKTGIARRVRVDDDGLDIASGARTNRLPWTAIAGVAETDDHVFVLTTDGAAHVLPRRVDPSGVAEVAAAVRAHVPTVA